MSGKSNNDEIYFQARDKLIEYFPRGLEKFFTKLTGIAIWGSQLKEIHQDDLKSYTKLKYFSLTKNNIEVIGDGLFDYQPDIEVIIFERSKIVHISPTVFDNLPKLTTLYLIGNKCTSKDFFNNRTGVLEVIKSVKSTCISPDFTKLDEKLTNLELNSKYLIPGNFTAFKKNVQNFEADLENSKFSNSQPLKERISRISFWKQLEILDEIGLIKHWKNYAEVKLSKIEAEISDSRAELNHKIESQNAQIILMSNKIDHITRNCSELMKPQETTENQRSIIQNPWIIIATAVVGFTQVIIYTVIYKQFLA
jgi:hypothetical protein